MMKWRSLGLRTGLAAGATVAVLLAAATGHGQSPPPHVVLPPLDQAAEPPTELRTTVPLGQSLLTPPKALPRFFSGRHVILDVPRLDAELGPDAAPDTPPAGVTGSTGTPPAR